MCLSLEPQLYTIISNYFTGFVRFSDMNDQREALIHMNGFVGMPGHPGKPIRVSMAVPKPCLSEASKVAEKQSGQYSHMYENYWSDKDAWGNYGTYQGNVASSRQGGPALTTARYYAERAPVQPLIVSELGSANPLDWDLLGLDSEDEDNSDLDEDAKATKELNENRLIEHDVPVNVDAMNAEYIARSQEVWDAVERDRWIYNLENDDGIAPNFNKNRKRRNKGTNYTKNIPTNSDANNTECQGTTQDITAPDDGFGPGPVNVGVTEDVDAIPNLMDIPESELEQ